MGWDVTGDEAVLWVDASSLALGAALEVDGKIVEDASWLRQDECAHINLAELDAVIRGLNLALFWQMKKLTLMTDSRTMYHWLVGSMTGESRLKTKASSEMLIRRRLETFRNIIEEYSLSLEVRFVSSTKNRADVLTRIPKKWISARCDDIACAAAIPTVPDEAVINIHETSGHPGIKRTLYFCRKRHPDVRHQQVRSIVRNCKECQSIDPAPQRWQRGQLSVAKIWSRVSMDICHVKNTI